MDQIETLSQPLPRDADAAVEIVRALRSAGHEALLAGGCVRDLLLGADPHDFDVATDALPDRVCQLFRPTRKVGAAFGVVLVKSKQRWIEVATFRTDGDYRDGRRPESVTFTDARHDALRRDFTVNGMFLDPLDRRIIDYVDGRADLAQQQIRAIGDPAARFAEDHLRLLRAVRFAARLDFSIEPATADAMRRHAPQLRAVAAERVLEELAKMLAAPTRARALELTRDTALLPFLWSRNPLRSEHADAALEVLRRVPEPIESPVELSFAVLVSSLPLSQIEEICRDLRMSNELREMILWFVRHHADLDNPATPTLADLKRLMAGPAFAALRAWTEARYVIATHNDAKAVLAARIAAIPPDAIAPPPFVTGDDLLARGVTAGPIFKRVLDDLYTRQLNEELTSRTAALEALEAALRTS